MSRRLTLLLAATLSFQPFPSGRAAEIGKPVERTVSGDMTLGRAVAIALRQNPDILKALQEIERTRGQVIEVRAQALPHLTLSGNYDWTDPNLIESSGGSGGSSSNFDSSSLTSGGSGLTDDALSSLTDALEQSSNSSGSQAGGSNDQSWSVTLQVRQVLYAGGQVRAAMKIASLTEDNSYWSLRDTIDSVIARTRTQFYDVLLNRALIGVTEESVQLQTDQLKDQQNRFEAGTVPRFNVLRAEVELANVRPTLIRAKNNYLIAQLDLAKTLGLEAAHDGKPTFTVVGQLNTNVRPGPLPGALAMARERRPFLKVQRQRILIEKEQVKVALAGYKPRLDASGGWLVRNSRLTDQLDDTVNGWFFGLSGSWALFDGFETAGKVKQAHATLETAKVTYEDSVQQVELEVQQAYANLQQARETIQSQQKNVEQALEALRLANERLAAGAGTQLDVLDARVALTRARSTEVEARADYAKALAEFDRATATNTIYDDGFDDPLAKKAQADRAKRAKKKKP
jgi:outer membrane protein TolC